MSVVPGPSFNYEDLLIKNPKFFSYMEVPAQTVPSTLGTSAQTLRFALPDDTFYIPAESSTDLILSAASGGANTHNIVQMARDNLTISERLLSNGQVLVDANLLNSGMSCLRNHLVDMETYQSNIRPGITNSASGAFGSPFPMVPNYPGGFGAFTTPAVDTTACRLPTIVQQLGESNQLPFIYLASGSAGFAHSANTPAEIFIDDTATATPFIFRRNWGHSYGTFLSLPVVVNSGQGCRYEVQIDSIAKQVATVPSATTVAALDTALDGALSAVGTVTCTNVVLRLLVLTDPKSIEQVRKVMRENELNIWCPWLETSVSSLGSSSSFSANLTFDASGRRLVAVGSAAVLPATGIKDTQNNAGSVGTTSLITVRASVNNIFDTPQTLSMTDGSAHAYLRYTLRGGPAADFSCYMNHPTYWSNFSGMSLVEAMSPNNRCKDIGADDIKSVAYVVTGTKDAVARDLFIAMFFKRRLRIAESGCMWSDIV